MVTRRLSDASDWVKPAGTRRLHPVNTTKAIAAAATATMRHEADLMNDRSLRDAHDPPPDDVFVTGEQARHTFNRQRRTQHVPDDRARLRSRSQTLERRAAH